MAQRLRGSIVLAEDSNSSGHSGLSLTPTSGDLAPSAGLCGHLHTYAHTQRIKSILKPRRK